jgi:RNA polymerase sigma-70 factor (ECF subfamily)
MNGRRSTNEEALIHAAKQGDLEAFNRLVLAHQDKLYNQAYYLLGDPMAAEDAVQETFLCAYLALGGYRGGSFRGWLARILTNKCIDELRRRNCHPTTPFHPRDEYGQEIESPYWCVDPGETPEQHLLQVEFEDLVWHCLELLNPEQRAVLTLVDLLGMEYDEVAEAMGCPMGTVKSRLARARVKMQRFLRNYLEPVPTSCVEGGR